MKVSAISFSENKPSTLDSISKKATINPFLYTSTQQHGKCSNEKYIGVTLLAAAATLGTALLAIKGKKLLSKNIVELADKNLGLNKLEKYQRTATELKEQILYPLKAKMAGEKSFVTKNNFRSGVIVTGEDGETLTNFMKAFEEHALGLQINCRSMPQSAKRNQAAKWAYNAIESAGRSYNDTGKYTLINLGNLENLVNLKVAKLENSNIEDFIRTVDYTNYPGVVWTAWTTKINSVPLYFNELPVLVTKLA